MSRRLVVLAAASLLAGCTTLHKQPRASWSECAHSAALAILSKGIDPSWPKAPELPAGEPIETIDLGPYPANATHDAFMRTLYLAPGRNVVYVRQSGGFSGVDQLFGPISLQEHCPVQTTGMP